MKEFIVFRHGWNAANQSAYGCPHKMPVARVTAVDEKEAKSLVLEKVTVYNNQYLSVEDAKEYDKEQARIDEAVTLL